jgi:hypothetical protein
MRRILIALAAVALAALSCQQAPEGYREALANFDDLVGKRCPSESLVAIARAMGARSDDVRVVHYGPTGQPDHTCYFAALSRDGAVLAGVLDEASNNVTDVAYEDNFNRDDFVWVMKCLRSDPPFGDRKVRYGPALPVEIKRRVDGVAVKFVDGWLEDAQKWSTGEVEVNLAGTKLLSEDHGLDFAIR